MLTLLLLSELVVADHSRADDSVETTRPLYELVRVGMTRQAVEKLLQDESRCEMWIDGRLSVYYPKKQIWVQYTVNGIVVGLPAWKWSPPTMAR